MKKNGNKQNVQIKEVAAHQDSSLAHLLPPLQPKEMDVPQLDM